MARLTLALGATALLLATRSQDACAQPPLAEARAHYEGAEFEDALEAITTLEREGEFDRDTYVELLRLRATILFALGRKEWRRDLVALAAMAPAASLGPESPPPLQRAFADIKRSTEAMELSASAESFPDGVLLTARGSAVPEVSTRLQIFGRTRDHAWRRGRERLMVEQPAGVVEYYAELLGPGNAVLRNAGTRAEPLRYVWRSPVVTPLADPAETKDEEGGSSFWPWVGVVGGVAVAAATAAVIFFAVQEPDTRVSLPPSP